MTEEQVLAKLRQILQRLKLQADTTKITNTENLFASGVLDSLSLIQFVLLVEEEFNIRLDNTDINYDQFKSLQAVAQRIRDGYQV